MNQHTLQQLRQYFSECKESGKDPFKGNSEIAKAACEARDLFATEAKESQLKSYGPFSGPAEHPDVVAREGLDRPEVQAMSYTERRERNIPVCRRDHTGRCRECQHQGPCPYQKWVGGTRPNT
jgi:hypothetical protein